MATLTFKRLTKIANNNMEFINIPTVNGAELRIEICEDVYIHEEYNECSPWDWDGDIMHEMKIRIL